ncbi:uncharacterized protein LOC129578249 isoform X2 [Sitodiplosis mosellana]|uniref:uncharacterized protein LOC129578249 isoform X2 n=1 Tax=Sitodiplosis mosellana TaxID=263140 RepID=UPI0024449D17|nr:uncharacterized protein LOC129578249 isoform X2 [Sitodiplosis mosellana]
MPAIECAICSEEFGKRNDNDSSDVVVTPCGHVFHEMCLSKWLQYGVQAAEPKTCPECRQAVTMSQTRRIYFNFSAVIDNVSQYVEYLDQIIMNKNNKLHMASIQLEKIKHDWTSKLREKDHEIQRLHDKLKHREQDFEVQKLHAKIEKLKSKLRESKHKHSPYPKVTTMGAVQLGMNENMGMHPSQYNAPETMNPMRTNLMQPNNCDAATSIFNQNLYAGQSSGSSTTVQNPFDCDISTINTNLRSIRNPLSTFAPSYQAQNGYVSTNPMDNAMMNSYNAMMNSIQTAHTTQSTQQQTISYNQTSFFLPIQTTNSINATAYFNTNDQNHQNLQNHFIGQ